MRALILTAVSAAGLLAGAAGADAGEWRWHAPVHRAGPVIVYDDEPGVVVRAYWASPWRHRHYFPRTGHKPKSGRREDLAAHGHYPIPARTFERYWSTSFAEDLYPARPLAPAPLYPPLK